MQAHWHGWLHMLKRGVGEPRYRACELMSLGHDPPPFRCETHIWNMVICRCRVRVSFGDSCAYRITKPPSIADTLVQDVDCVDCVGGGFFCK